MNMWDSFVLIGTGYNTLQCPGFMRNPISEMGFLTPFLFCGRKYLNHELLSAAAFFTVHLNNVKISKSSCSLIELHFNCTCSPQESVSVDWILENRFSME